MKRLFLLPGLIFSLLFLCSCGHDDTVNLLHFTDNLNKLNSQQEIELSDYLIDGSSYKLILKEDSFPLLLVLDEDENGKIKKVRLTLSKTDDSGNIKEINDKECAFFLKNAAEILSAFTFFEKEECEALLSRFLPQKAADYSKTGELTTEKENFHLVYYSNKICCQFFVSDTFLEKTSVTQKPVSKSTYAETTTAS